MKWYALNKKYVEYLKQFDKIVPDINYTGRLKCFLGVVFQTKDGIQYFAPLTSYKAKFKVLKNDIDFYKIVDKNNKIYGAIDINNMIPVPKSEILEITKENLGELRDFNNDREKRSYWKLLKKEMACINENAILNSAEKLYHFVTTNPSSPLAQRCCNFSKLEIKYKEYIKLKQEPKKNRKTCR